MTRSEKIAIIYHELFHYTLSKYELKKWTAGRKLTLEGNSRKSFVVKARQEVDSINKAKKKIALDSAALLQKVPTIMFVGITGSLAMNNAKRESDIDLMVITKHNTLWLTRFCVMPLLFVLGFKLRRAGVKDEEDKLCFNYWIDESALSWEGPRNAYIAHEVAQVVPLVNKHTIYEKWISSNSWVLEYWPYATLVKVAKAERLQHSKMFLLYLVNRVCFAIQKAYMFRKITRETITLTKAHFHPYDWSLKVITSLNKRGVKEL